MRMTLLAFCLRQRDHYRHFSWAALAGRNFVRLKAGGSGLGLRNFLAAEGMSVFI